MLDSQLQGVSLAQYQSDNILWPTSCSQGLLRITAEMLLVLEVMPKHEGSQMSHLHDSGNIKGFDVSA